MKLKVLVVTQGVCLALLGVAMAAPASQDVVTLRIVGSAAVVVGVASIACTLLGSQFVECRPLLLLAVLTAVVGINLGLNAEGELMRLVWLVYAFGAALAAAIIAARPPTRPIAGIP